MRGRKGQGLVLAKAVNSGERSQEGWVWSGQSVRKVNALGCRGGLRVSPELWGLLALRRQMLGGTRRKKLLQGLVLLCQRFG